MTPSNETNYSYCDCHLRPIKFPKSPLQRIINKILDITSAVFSLLASPFTRKKKAEPPYLNKRAVTVKLNKIDQDPTVEFNNPAVTKLVTPAQKLLKVALPVVVEVQVGGDKPGEKLANELKSTKELEADYNLTWSLAVGAITPNAPISLEFRNFLNILLEGAVDIDHLHEKLATSMKKECPGTDGDRTKCINWLLDTNRSDKPLNGASNEPQMQKMLQWGLSFLQGALRPTPGIKGPMLDLLKSVLIENSQVLADVIMQRMDGLLTNIDYPTAFDNIRTVLSNHIYALVAAEQEAKKTKKKDGKTTEEKRLQAYAETFYHPKLALVKEVDGTVKKEAMNEIRDEMIDHAVEVLIPALFPDQPDGKGGKIDGIVSMLKERGLVKLPEDSKLGEAKKVFMEFLRPRIRQQVEKQLTPANVDSLIARQVLPTVQETLLQSMARFHYSEDKSIEALKNQPPVDDKAREEALYKALYELAESSCKNYCKKIVDGKVSAETDDSKWPTYEAYKKLIAPVFEEFRQGGEVVEAKKDDMMGDLAVDLLKELGELNPPARGVAWGVINRLAKKEIPNSLQVYRESPDHILGILADKFDEWAVRWTAEPSILKELVSGVETKNAAELKEERNVAIAETSNLLYDLIILEANTKWVPNCFNVAQLGIGKNPKKLEDAITKICDKVLGNATINENITFKIDDVVLRTLEDASARLDGHIAPAIDPSRVT